MKEIYLLRHGQTAFNVEKRVQGKGVNSSLDEVGTAQGRAFFEYYRNHGFDLIITSSLNRTKETVRHFIEELNIPQQAFEELDEISWGIYEGQPASEEMHREHKNVITHWSHGNYDARISEGESALEMQSRLHKFLSHLITLPQKRLLICTHGGTLAFLMTIFQELPLSRMPEFKHRNTGLCKFHFDGTQFHLELRDDLSHLE
jgi:probable phosphoglycerate mutase